MVLKILLYISSSKSTHIFVISSAILFVLLFKISLYMIFKNLSLRILWNISPSFLAKITNSLSLNSKNFLLIMCNNGRNNICCSSLSAISWVLIQSEIFLKQMIKCSSEISSGYSKGISLNTVVTYPQALLDYSNPINPTNHCTTDTLN